MNGSNDLTKMTEDLYNWMTASKKENKVEESKPKFSDKWRLEEDLKKTKVPVKGK